MSLEFLSLVLSRHKRLLQTAQIFQLPKLERFVSLTITNLLAWADDNIPDLHDYIPDVRDPQKLSKKYLVDVNEYLINVMNTLSRGCIERLRQDAIIQANAGNNLNGGNNRIALANQFEGIIQNPLFPLNSSRRLLNSLARRPN